MKIINWSKKRLSVFIAVFLLFLLVQLSAQQSAIDKSIAENRMGKITVKAKPGAKVTVEQQNHEFWFGCAISDGIFNGRASEADQQQYKEKFLENFNSAVTENAVKWGNMERRKRGSAL